VIETGDQSMVLEPRSIVEQNELICSRGCFWEALQRTAITCLDGFGFDVMTTLSNAKCDAPHIDRSRLRANKKDPREKTSRGRISQ